MTSHSRPALRKFCVVQAASEKFGLHAGNNIFNTHNKERIHIHKIIRIILPVDFSVRLYNKKYEQLIIGKFINKTQFTSLASVSLFVAHFYKMNYKCNACLLK